MQNERGRHSAWICACGRCDLLTKRHSSPGKPRWRPRASCSRWGSNRVCRGRSTWLIAPRNEPAVTSLRRAAHVHDLGRVAISAQIWQKTTPLTTDDRERIRLHPYYTERVLNRSPFLGSLASIATTHHERLDGGGYHRGLDAATLSGPARILAAADVYQAMTSPRPHREALTAPDASRALQDEARAGRLDAEAVGAVLAAAGHERPRLARPAGLTEREVQVIGLLAHGLPTKQIARVLGISAKTADRHVQNSYAKIGVSSRAAAALFAMQHGLTTWGELPMVTSDRRS